jgi:hypothetical protein
MTRMAMLGVTLTAAVLAGCDLSADEAPGARTTTRLPPVAVGARVAFVDAATALAFVIDPAAPTLAARPVRVGKHPVLAVARPGHDELLVLSRGVRDQPGVEAEPAQLTSISTESDRPARSIPLGSRFDALTLSPDGRFAVLHFNRNAPPSPETTLLVNPNEVAVLDLDAATPAMTTATSRTLRSFGGVPQAVLFSPPLPLRGPSARALRLAVVLSDNYVTLLDLENDRTEITISLTRADERRTLRPLQALFDDGDAMSTSTPTSDPTIFLRIEGSNDIVALRLVPSPEPRAERANDFRPVLSLLGSGGRPSDMALYDTPAGVRLLLLAPDTSEAAVIDPVTSRVTSFRLDAAADRLVLYEGTSPAESQRRPRALLLAPGGGQVGFLDLDQLEERRAQNLELRPMSGPVSQFVPLPDRGVVVANHSGGSIGLSVIDLERRTVAPLQTEQLGDVLPGPAPADELWVVPRTRVRVGRLLLSRLTAEEVRLDMSVNAVLPLAASAGGRRFVVLDHARDGGAITVVDADKPERKTARSLIGFLHTNLLDRSRP